MRRPSAVLGPILGACWAFSAIPACTVPAPGAALQHLGPVSGLALGGGGEVWSCSQAGILTAAPGGGAPAATPVPFRPFALARIERLDALLVAGGTPGRSGHLALALPGGEMLHARRLAGDVLYAVAVDPTGRHAAAGGADGTVWLCELDDGGGMTADARSAHAGPCRAVAFSPHGPALASGGRDGGVLLWRSGGEAPAPLRGHTAGVECLVFSADGRQVASGALDGRVRLHSLDGRLVRSWHRLGAPVQALAADAAGFFAGLADGRVLFLDPEREDAEAITSFPEPVHALAKRDHELIAGLHGRVARVSVRRGSFDWQHR